MANLGENVSVLLNICAAQACPGDIDDSGVVDAADVALLLGAWGPCPKPCEEGDPGDTCPADLNGDCVVEAFDLALLLGAWGLCP